MSSRTAWLRTLCLALPIVCCSAGAQAQTALRVTYIPILDATPLFTAISKGYFKEEGLDVTPTAPGGGAAAVPGLMGGAYDILYTNIASTLLAKQQGFNLIIVAPGTKEYDGPRQTGLIARKDENIKSGKDLEGKTVAVNTRNGVIWLFARSWIVKTGGDASKVKFREVPFPQMNDALRGKQVDAEFQVAPFYDAALNGGDLEVVGDPYHEVQPGVEVGIYVATADYYNQNRQVIAKFDRALRKGVAWYNAHTNDAETIKIIADFTKLQPEVVAKMYKGHAPEKTDPATLEKTEVLMRDSGLLTSDVDVRSMIAPEATQ
jgi:NitT/TauT family transport system substrate-binding protein